MERLLPWDLHWHFCQPLQILVLTSHFVNGSESIILDLAVKVSGTACILLNGKFTVCIEELDILFMLQLFISNHV